MDHRNPGGRGVTPAGTPAPAISAVATPFEVSFPDKKELETILRETVRKVTSQRQVQINLSLAGLNAIVRNMQGLNRAQARRVIVLTQGHPDHVGGDLGRAQCRASSIVRPHETLEQIRPPPRGAEWRRV